MALLFIFIMSRMRRWFGAAVLTLWLTLLGLDRRNTRLATRKGLQRMMFQQARQDSNLQPPVLETLSLAVHGGTICTMGSGSKHVRGSLGVV